MRHMCRPCLPFNYYYCCQCHHSKIAKDKKHCNQNAMPPKDEPQYKNVQPLLGVV